MTEINSLPIQLIGDIRHILQSARNQAYSAVNQTMTHAYWQIGKRIVEEEQNGKHRAEYGQQILKTLSIALTGELGKGFSYANLRNFRQFYLTYPEQNCYALRSNLTWTHQRLIMRVDDPQARAYYLQECAEQQWSSRVLERHINTLYYQRLRSSQRIDNVNETEGLAAQESAISQLSMDVPSFIKDPYVLEFLNIAEHGSVSETQIEAALVHNLQHFLLELGKGFAFIGRQYRLSTETSHFYVDLVFYNVVLKCYVLFDLKTTKLTHQDTGQMDMYIRMFDDLKKRDDDNPTIGIILCAEKDETIIKYSILNEHKQMFAAKYMPYLPTEAELIAEIERERRVLGLDGGGDE